MARPGAAVKPPGMAIDPFTGLITWTPTQAQAEGWLYDTTLPANGNQGHQYGTQLSPEEKDALLEYLKTF